MSCYLGIDPGVSGAWIILNQNLKVEKWGLWEQWQDLFDGVGADVVTLAALEDVHSMPGQGVRSVFTFGKNFGHWQGALGVKKIPFILVTPQTWQKVILSSIVTRTPPPPGETPAAAKVRCAAHKKRLKESVVQFVSARIPALAHPLGVKKNWGVADAACLAMYALKIDRG
jgi:hypothetical protein